MNALEVEVSNLKWLRGKSYVFETIMFWLVREVETGNRCKCEFRQQTAQVVQSMRSGSYLLHAKHQETAVVIILTYSATTFLLSSHKKRAMFKGITFPCFLSLAFGYL